MAEGNEGQAEWMVLDEEGKQPYLSVRGTPAWVYSKLTAGGAKKWEAVFKAVLKPECGGLCVLECKRCKANVSPSNPSQAAQRHKCKQADLEKAGVRSSPRKQPREEDEVVDLSVDCVEQQHVAKKQNIAAYTVSATQHKQFHRLLAIHIIKEEVPFQRLHSRPSAAADP